MMDMLECKIILSVFAAAQSRNIMETLFCTGTYTNTDTAVVS